MNREPLLSICIPTYNRIGYLREILCEVCRQVEDLDWRLVEVLVSDNCSTDGTGQYCGSIHRPYFNFWTNKSNIGGDRNFLKCIQEARGEYVWLLGDDDLISSGSLEVVLGLISSIHPDLIASVNDGCGAECTYPSYGEFLAAQCKKSARPALYHTLISDNVFRRAVFDMAFAEENLYTQYAHMFGLVKNLEGEVVIRRGLINTRPVRADFAKFPSNLCVKQALYLRYLAKRFNQPQFRRFAFFNACNLPLEYASRFKNWVKRLFRF